MTESVTVVSVVPKKQGAKNGKAWTISSVTLEDGRVIDSFDAFKPGETTDVIVTPNANPQYADTMKRAKQAANDFVNHKNAETANKVLATNNEKDERITMLSCISSACNYYAQRGPANEAEVVEFAKKLFNLAIEPKGKDRLPF